MNHINHTVSNLGSDRKLFESLFDYDEVRGAFSSWNGKPIEYNYLRVREFRYWDEKEVNKIEELVKQFNEKAETCTMYVKDYQDYEVEWDNDRSWPASFHFEIVPKNN
jgi:hypothetical protein